MSDEVAKSGRSAIRLLYTFLISASIANSFRIVFPKGIDETSDILIPSLLLASFLTYILRFFLGSYRELTYDIESPQSTSKVVWDMIWLIIQAIIFILMSFSVKSITSMLILIFILLLIDSLWLLIQKYGCNYNISTFKQWITCNIEISILIILISLSLGNSGLGFYSSNILWASVLFVISLIATIDDFRVNLPYYNGAANVSLDDSFHQSIEKPENNQNVKINNNEGILSTSSISSEMDKSSLELFSEEWKTVITTQMHFNDLMLRFRSFVLAAFGAMFGAIIALHGSNTIEDTKLDLVLWILLSLWISAFIMDFCYYFNLLLGAVRYAKQLDKIGTNCNPRHFGLTSSIAQSVSERKSKVYIIIYYLLPLLVAIAVVLSIK